MSPRQHAAALAVAVGFAALSPTAPARAALSEYFVTPQQADSTVTQALEPHYVVIDRAVPRKGLLYVHLPGTTLAPQGSRLLVQAAAGAGLHAFGLMYPDNARPDDYCQLSTDALCYEKVHQEYFEGVDSSPLLSIGRADSIEGRLVKLLQYLEARFPADGWGSYLDASGSPVWSRIRLSGFSQGSAHAAFIGYSRAVNRVAFYSGPNENYADGRLPGWITAAHATPTTSYFGFSHQQDNAVQHLQIWRALGMEALGAPTLVDGASSPYGGSRMLFTNAAPAQGTEYHKSTSVDDSTPKRAGGTPLFADVWSLMGGFETPAAAATNAWILPSSARIAGAGGAFYTTDLAVANAGSEAVSFTLKFLGNGADGRSGEEKTFNLAAGATNVYADVLGTVFGLTSAFGAIRVTSASAGLVITSQTSTPGFGGTFGQAVPAVGASDLATTTVPRSIVGVREDASFRTNLFLANATESALAVDAALVGPSGQTLGTKRYDLPPLGMIQASRVVRDMGVSTNLAGGRLVLSTATAGGAFAAYASSIDNATNDPRTLLAR